MLGRPATVGAWNKVDNGTIDASRGAAEYFRKKGFTDVANVAGGINAWSTEIDESVPLRDHPEIDGIVDDLAGIALALAYAEEARDADEVPIGSGTKLARRPLDEQLHRNGW